MNSGYEDANASKLVRLDRPARLDALANRLHSRVEAASSYQPGATYCRSRLIHQAARTNA